MRHLGLEIRGYCPGLVLYPALRSCEGKEKYGGEGGLLKAGHKDIGRVVVLRLC